jgi:hypothetical protein
MDLYLYQHGSPWPPPEQIAARPLPPTMRRRISATPDPGVLDGERVPPNLPNGIRATPKITARSTVAPPSLELATASL